MTSKQHIIAIGALVVSVFFTALAESHETRILGKNPGDNVNPSAVGVNIRATVGFSGEPAFEDSFNGLDLFLYTYDGTCPIDTADFYGNPIATANGDTVNLKVDLLYLERSVVPGGATGNVAPPRIIKSLTMTDQSPLRGAFGEPGTFNSDFKATHPGNPDQGGAYGFHIYGKVTTVESQHTCDADSPSPTTKTNPARDVNLDQYWICEAGFRVPPGGPATPRARGSFNCIRPIQVFPGKPEDGYKPNRPFNPWHNG
jgi:hypothetical protein